MEKHDRGSYVEYVVEEGERHTIRLGDGEMFENALLNQEAEGSCIYVRGDGDSWTVRNVGWKGELDHENQKIQLYPKTEGDCTIECVYMGDGAKSHYRHKGMWMPPEASGTLEIVGLHCGGFGDNGVYGSGPGVPKSINKRSNPGNVEIHVRNSHFRNSNVSNLRLGTTGSTVKNTSVKTEKGEVVDFNGPPHNARGFWFYRHDIVVKNCDIDCQASGGGAICVSKGATAKLENTRFSGGTKVYSGEGDIDGESVGEPDVGIPVGCPRSALEAATGKPTGDRYGEASETDVVAEPPSVDEIVRVGEENTIAFRATGELAEYLVGVEGVINPGPNANIDKEDRVGADFAEGAVAGTGVDDYHFDGVITGGEVDDSIEVLVNGTPVDFAELVEFFDGIDVGDEPEPETPDEDVSLPDEIHEEQLQRLDARTVVEILGKERAMQLATDVIVAANSE